MAFEHSSSDVVLAQLALTIFKDDYQRRFGFRLFDNFHRNYIIILLIILIINDKIKYIILIIILLYYHIVLFIFIEIMLLYN